MICSDFFFNDVRHYRPKIAISACLLGEPVRYDGECRSYPLINDFFQEYADVVSICPEVAAGLGTPRPAIGLINTVTGIKAQGVYVSALDATDALTRVALSFIHNQLPLFHGLILKSRSPSCGLNNTPIRNSNGSAWIGNGLFSQAMLDNASNCAFSHEDFLISEERCHAFLLQCKIHLDISLTSDEKLDNLSTHYKEQGIDIEKMQKAFY